MKDITFFMGNARHLNSHLATKWDNYDFKEKSKDVEKRVPSIEFALIRDVEIEEKASEYVMGHFGYEKFVRNFLVTYKDGKYLFTISVTSHLRCVKRYELTVYLMMGEEKTRLFTERL